MLTPPLFFLYFNFWQIGDRAVFPFDFGAEPPRCYFLYSPLRQTFDFGGRNFEIMMSTFLGQIGDHAVFSLGFGAVTHVNPLSLELAPDTLWEPKSC